jgi:hypothetical protein
MVLDDWFAVREAAGAGGSGRGRDGGGPARLRK